MDNIKTEIELLERKTVQKQIDYKMVTFSLGGKAYGIDILKIKEISKIDKYTYVPNTLPYVLGVHNLRGDIIPLIDMRRMFHLPIPSKSENELLNTIILRLNEYNLGIVVDSIDKVVGISSKSIQPPPPLFGDINIQYIHGVTEYSDNLYIILDVDKIFKDEEDTSVQKPVPGLPEKSADPARAKSETDYHFNFIVETLATFKNYYVTDLNKSWVERRFVDWKKNRESQGIDFQLQNEKDGDEFLIPFYSSSTNRLFGEDLKKIIDTLLPSELGGTINIWNSGCSKGYESYSIASIARLKYPKAIIKVWANDYDLFAVSTAPSLFFAEGVVPDYLIANNFVEQGPNGYQFKKEIKDIIYFEYHDTLHKNAIPDIDFIIARDVLSFQSAANQKKMLNEFSSKLKGNGLLIIGDNEKINAQGWIDLDINGISVFKKES